MSSNTNFATFNQLSNQAGNGALGSAYSDLDKSNTEFYVSNGSSGMATTIATPSSGGKWYCEFYLSGSVGNYAWVGYYPIAETPEVKKQWSPSNNTTWIDSGLVSVHSMGRYFYTDGQYTDSGATSFTAGDVISIALDLDNGATYFAKNGTYMNSGNPASGSSKTGAAPVEGSYSKEYLLAVGSAGSSGHTWTINAGQDSTFNGAISAGGNTDANGFGDFKYTVPSGYLSLCSANVPVSDDIDPAGDNGADENPTKQFGVVTYTGNGSTINVTGVGFQPDFVWIKMRSPHAYNHMMFDTNRGVTKHISSDRTNSEFTTSNSLTSFDSDGFTYGNELSGNDSGDSFVAWCWKANSGVTSSNSDGSITTTLQVGKCFSIGTYTGTGSNATVGHGLGAVPDFTLFKRRDASGNWVATSQKNMSSNDHNLYLQLDNAQSDGNYFQNTAMTSSVISIVTHADINGSSNTYVMYNFINVEGYQKFGKYTGNGNTNGPFIYTGFRPRLFFVKLLDSAGDWWIHDTARNTHNTSTNYVAWNRTDTETYGIDVDFLCNGIKIRTSSGDFNSSGADILYGAWGSVPFKYNNIF